MEIAFGDAVHAAIDWEIETDKATMGVEAIEDGVARNFCRRGVKMWRLARIAVLAKGKF
ncbi:MAG: hypothetical protein CM15mP46_2910 [Alphaproteobacteria bacterium]|nr:MAG: hypothetical protein CM15mP46_2910 [Alphaproteobacteria bacterium]